MKKYAVYVLAILLGVVFYGSAIMKLSGAPAMSATFQHLGLEDWRIFIGGLEIVCVTLLFLPWTRVIGFLLMASFMGGAIVAHLSHGELPFVQVAILSLVWLLGYLRDPQLFQAREARADTRQTQGVTEIQAV